MVETPPQPQRKAPQSHPAPQAPAAAPAPPATTGHASPDDPGDRLAIGLMAGIVALLALLTLALLVSIP